MGTQTNALPLWVSWSSMENGDRSMEDPDCPLQGAFSQPLLSCRVMHTVMNAVLEAYQREAALLEMDTFG